MSIDLINLGTIPNDGTGTPLRSGGEIINDNFQELDTRTAQAQTDASAGISAAATADAKAVAAQAKADAAIPQSAAGVSIAQLVAGTVPANQLPSYVDDILEFPNLGAFPATGETGKIYIAINDGASLSNPTKQYRWSGSAYVLIPASPGSTDEVAEGSTNKYFTEPRVRATPLTGFSNSVKTPVVAADSVLQGIGKLQGQINDLVDKQVTLIQYRFIATAGQSVFTGLDKDGKLFGFPAGSVMLVTIQGFDLWETNDYTTTGTDTLTLVGSVPVVAGDELSVIVFSPFTVADHYTKAEDDARYVQKTAVIDVAHGGTGKTTEFRKGFIDGLRLVYTSRTTLTVTAGSAYIPFSGKIVELSADKVVTPTLSASTWYHVYLYENGGVGDIEVVTTIPARYHGTAYNKNGDTARRYLGSILTNASSQIFGFRHEVSQGKMMFTEGSPGVSPFNFISNFTTASAWVLTGNATFVCPLATSTTVHVAVAFIGTGSISVAPADQVTGAPPGPSNWDNSATGTANSVIPFDIQLSRNPANPGGFYLITTVNLTLYARGYSFER